MGVEIHVESDPDFILVSGEMERSDGFVTGAALQETRVGENRVPEHSCNIFGGGLAHSKR